MDSIFFTWHNKDPLTGFRAECVKKAREIYPDVKLVCISNLQDPLPGGTFDLVLPWDYYIEKIWKTYFIKNSSVMLQSDFIRYHYLSVNPHTLYLDTDIYLQKPISEVTYIGIFKRDISAIWNGQYTGFFDNLLRNARGGGISSGYLKGFFPYDCTDLSAFMTHKTDEIYGAKASSGEGIEAISDSVKVLQVINYGTKCFRIAGNGDVTIPNGNLDVAEDCRARQCIADEDNAGIASTTSLTNATAAADSNTPTLTT